jgi:hypothetical protein
MVPLVGLEHLDDGLRREIFSALFPLREGERVEEVFVNVAEDVLTCRSVCSKGMVAMRSI